MAFSFFRRWRQKGAAIPAQAPVDDDMEWFFPPADVHDPICWDQYWKNQVAHGVTPRLCDLFSFFVPQLIDCLQKRGARTVLCAGNGGSQEPKALAAAGFQVTVMDLSPAALFLAEKWEFTPKDLDEFCTEKQRMRGGSVKFVTGDIVDVAVCPGPFDAIIERRMLQLFPEAERGTALDCLAARLQANGFFLSHCHDGGWRPPAKRVHHVEQYFRDRGWRVWENGPGDEFDDGGRVAYLQLSTG